MFTHPKKKHLSFRQNFWNQSPSMVQNLLILLYAQQHWPSWRQIEQMSIYKWKKNLLNTIKTTHPSSTQPLHQTSQNFWICHMFVVCHIASGSPLVLLPTGPMRSSMKEPRWASRDQIPPEPFLLNRPLWCNPNATVVSGCTRGRVKVGEVTKLPVISKHRSPAHVFKHQCWLNSLTCTFTCHKRSCKGRNIVLKGF